MGASARDWTRLVEPHFSFLQAHGFRLSPADDSSWWETWVQYASDASAVRLARSTEFGRVDVHLIRLVDGAVPPYPVWVTSEPLNWVLLDTVLQARSAELFQQVAAQRGLDDSQVERQLAFWASALVSVAPEFLHGDMAAVDEAETIVRERVHQHPQQATVWVPEDAASDLSARQAQATAATVPPEVSVVVRRYRHPRSGRRPAGAG